MSGTASMRSSRIAMPYNYGISQLTRRASPYVNFVTTARSSHGWLKSSNTTPTTRKLTLHLNPKVMWSDGKLSHGPLLRCGHLAADAQSPILG